MGDPERYRERKEIESWRKDDPIGIFRKHLIEDEGIEAKKLGAEEFKAESAVEEAVQFAESSSNPSPETLYDYVYID